MKPITQLSHKTTYVPFNRISTLSTKQTFVSGLFTDAEYILKGSFDYFECFVRLYEKVTPVSLWECIKKRNNETC